MGCWSSLRQESTRRPSHPKTVNKSSFSVCQTFQTHEMVKGSWSKLRRFSKHSVFTGEAGLGGEMEGRGKVHTLAVSVLVAHGNESGRN